MIDFQRISNVENRDRLFQKFSVKLEDHIQTVNCYVSCDEIAGTLQEALIQPHIPKSQFPDLKPLVTTKVHEDHEKDFDDEDIRNEDLLDAELGGYTPREDFARTTRDDKGNRPNQSRTLQSSNVPKSATTDNSAAQGNLPSSVKKLANGRFACNHTCKDKTMYIFPCPRHSKYADFR